MVLKSPALVQSISNTLAAGIADREPGELAITSLPEGLIESDDIRRCGIGIAFFGRMPRYHFKLVDGQMVADHGVHDLPDETTAQIEAIKLAGSLRETRANLLRKNYSIVVIDEDGATVCTIPLEID